MKRKIAICGLVMLCLLAGLSMGQLQQEDFTTMIFDGNGNDITVESNDRIELSWSGQTSPYQLYRDVGVNVEQAEIQYTLKQPPTDDFARPSNVVWTGMSNDIITNQGTVAGVTYEYEGGNEMDIILARGVYEGDNEDFPYEQNNGGTVTVDSPQDFYISLNYDFVQDSMSLSVYSDENRQNQIGTTQSMMLEESGYRYLSPGFIPSTIILDYEIHIENMSTSIDQDIQFISGRVTDRDQNGIENVTISHNETSQSISTGSNGEYNDFPTQSGTFRFTAEKSGFASDSEIVTIDGSQEVNFRLLQETHKFSFDIQQWMAHGTTQNYEAEFVETSGSSLNAIDITNEIDVTTANESLVSVDQQNQTLSATSDETVNNRTTITANYTDADGDEWQRSHNVTVANRTIDNIGIMPSNQYLNTFIGIDEPGTIGGIGAQIQWVYLAIIIASAIGGIGRNPYLGLGSLSALIILFWLIGSVTVSILIVSLLYAIAISLVLIDIPTRDDIQISIENNDQPPPEF